MLKKSVYIVPPSQRMMSKDDFRGGSIKSNWSCYACCETLAEPGDICQDCYNRWERDVQSGALSK